MPSGKRACVLIRLSALPVLLAGLLITAALVTTPETVRISTMEGYVSRYHPGHLASGEAWRLAQTDGGAVILDLRSQASYEERHVAGAINVPPETLAAYAAQNLPDKDRAIICYCFCGDKGGSALSAYDLLTELGYTNVSYTEPEDEWRYEGTLVVAQDDPNLKIITGDQAMAMRDQQPGVILLDVRNWDEYAAGHIDGSLLIPVAELSSRLSELPDKNAVIIVYCKAGTRSASALRLLAAAGYAHVYDMQRVADWPEPLVAQ